MTTLAQIEKRAILKLAAEAYGLDCGQEDSLVGEYVWDKKLLSWWSSLHYDVDCHRLALELRLSTIHEPGKIEIKSHFYSIPSVVECFDQEGQRGPATRLAVTRAAALVKELMA